MTERGHFFTVEVPTMPGCVSQLEQRGSDEHPQATLDCGSGILRVDLVENARESYRRDFTLRLQAVGQTSVTASVRLSTTIKAGSPHWLIPGLFYGENRPANSARLFPRYQPGPGDIEQLTAPRWSFRSDRCATPIVFAWGDESAVALATRECSDVGLTGLGFSEPGAHGDARVHLDFPFCEEPVSYYGSSVPLPAQREAFKFVPGVIHEVKFSLLELPSDRHSYARPLREIWEQGASSNRGVEWVDLYEASDVCAGAMMNWHYDENPGVLLETVGFDREVTVNGAHVDRQAMHVAWVSGIPWCYALLRNGLRTGEISKVDAAGRVIDFITANLSPSGLFWGTWYRETGWKQSWSPIKDGLHARTLGEACLFLVRSIVAERKAGREHPRWVAALKSNLETVAGMASNDGNLGAVYHSQTGRVLLWDGAAGLPFVSAFIEATDAGLGDYRQVAHRAGDYYSRFVDQEFIHGAPEDVDLAPTSEDGYSALMAYMSLYRSSPEPKWLDLATRSAEWMLTFRYSYDVTFSKQTLLGAYDFSSRGADQASPSNQHLHNYGLICTKEMLELSEATADSYYAKRARETAECFRQFIARRDGDFNAYKGMVTERYYQTECFQPKGMILTLSHAWCVGATILGSEDLIAAQTRGDDCDDQC